jgi:predicted DNA-binding transcriptional regulator AlpA
MNATTAEAAKPIESYLTLPEMLGLLLVSRATLMRWVALPDFPQPIRPGHGRLLRWKKSDITDYLESLHGSV